MLATPKWNNGGSAGKTGDGAKRSGVAFAYSRSVTKPKSSTRPFSVFVTGTFGASA